LRGGRASARPRSDFSGPAINFVCSRHCDHDRKGAVHVRARLKVFAAAFCCLLAAWAAVAWIIGKDTLKASHADSQPAQPLARQNLEHAEPTFADPNAPGTRKTVSIGSYEFDSGVFSTAVEFTGTPANALSLEELGRAIRDRHPRGLAFWREKAQSLVLGSPPSAEEATLAIRTWRALAFLEMYEGRFAEAKSWLARGLELSRIPGVEPLDRAYLRALLGIVALRRGELENCINCVGQSSCIFPIEADAIHQNPSGSREAIDHFSAYLDESPGDLRIRWLLNLAYMTLGEYPDKVPAAYRIPIDRYRSTSTVGRFPNVATVAGLNSRGPTMAGGSIFDDFTGDGLPDVFTTSVDADRGASFFVNLGNGRFEDRSQSAGLDGQIRALNVARADFDNDGDLDVLLLRGGWETLAPLSLLRNAGAGVFEDVTYSSGMGVPIATESAAWGDYNNDGLVDVFICGEYRSVVAAGGSVPELPPDPRNMCRLYRALGDGKFVDVAPLAGVTNERVAKGAVWGDYDDDGRLDLFVSNMGAPSRLYHNEGNERFTDVTEHAGILTPDDPFPVSSFPCLFFDFDNDGRLDLLINDLTMSQGEVIADMMGISARLSSPPRLYRNLGSGNFQNVCKAVHLDRPIPAMSINCGDIDNDGYLDLYFGTGWMSYSGLVPNVLLKNVEGRRFDDVTTSSRTGHLQKGHGVSFADWDGDGDLDLFTVLGGGYPGDRGFSALFANPGHAGNWLKVKLVGTQSNRAALGAKIQIEIRDPDGTLRSIHRTIGTNGSFGGNSLVELIGIGSARSVEKLTVVWPTSHPRQIFEKVAAGQFIVITEGEPTLGVLSQPKSIAAKTPIH
jgi:tetratricopeptide (TPR) repeat protein